MAEAFEYFLVGSKRDRPDPELSELLELVVDNALLRGWRAETTELETVELAGWTERSGVRHDVHPPLPAWIDRPRASLLEQDLEMISLSCQITSPAVSRSPEAWSSLGFPIHVETRQWLPGRGTVEGFVQLDAFDEGVPAIWCGLMRDFFVEAVRCAAVEVGAASVMAFHRSLVPGARLWEPRQLKHSDWESGAVPGIAPVFVLHSAAVDRLGGVDAVVRSAPVYSAEPVSRSSGDVIVVQVGNDHDDFLRRLNPVVNYFRHAGVW